MLNSDYSIQNSHCPKTGLWSQFLFSYCGFWHLSSPTETELFQQSERALWVNPACTMENLGCISKDFEVKVQPQKRNKILGICHLSWGKTRFQAHLKGSYCPSQSKWQFKKPVYFKDALYSIYSIGYYETLLVHIFEPSHWQEMQNKVCGKTQRNVFSKRSTIKKLSLR